MQYHPFLDRTGLALLGVVLSGSVLIGLLLVGPSIAGEEPKTATEKSAEYVDTAKPTADGTVHPNGVEVKPREQWFSPCPADKKITTSGDCVGMDEPGSGKDAQK